MQGEADSHRDARAHHGRAQAADGVADGTFPFADGDDGVLQEGNAELGADGIEDRAYQQRAEQTLRHGAQSVNAVTLEGEDHILALTEFFPFFHRVNFLFYNNECIIPLAGEILKGKRENRCFW